MSKVGRGLRALTHMNISFSKANPFLVEDCEPIVAEYHEQICLKKKTYVVMDRMLSMIMVNILFLAHNTN